MRISASFVLVLITQTLITDVSLTLWARVVFFFSIRSTATHFSVSVYACVCFLNWISTGISGRLRNTYWKKTPKKNSKSVNRFGRCICVKIYLQVCNFVCSVWKKVIFIFRFVRQINCYLDFNLTSNKFSNTYCLRIWHWQCDNCVTKKILLGIKNGANKDNPNLK